MPSTSLLDKLFEALKEKQYKMVSAESCTGGLLAASVTSIAGASAIFDRGFITYSNEAKHDNLGVPMALIHEYGAVSPQVAVAMAMGALEHSLADVAVAITGIAGPEGGSDDKPVGSVYIACARRVGEPIMHHFIFDGDRHDIQKQSAHEAMNALLEIMERPE